MARKERLVNFRVTEEQYHLLCQKAWKRGLPGWRWWLHRESYWRWRKDQCEEDFGLALCPR